MQMIVICSGENDPLCTPQNKIKYVILIVYVSASICLISNRFPIHIVIVKNISIKRTDLAFLDWKLLKKRRKIEHTLVMLVIESLHIWLKHEMQKLSKETDEKITAYTNVANNCFFFNKKNAKNTMIALH